MKQLKCLGLLAIVGLSLSLCPAEVFADKPAKRAKKTMFSVVLIGSEIKVVESSEVPTERKALDDQYREELRAYQAAKKAAKESKVRFRAKLPARPTFRIVKSRIDSKEKADKLVESTRAKIDPFVIVFDGSEYRIARKLGVPALAKELAEAHALAYSEWETAKADAKAKKQRFSAKAPKKPTLKTVATGLASEELAKAKLEAIESKRTKKSPRGKAPAPKPQDENEDEDL